MAAFGNVERRQLPERGRLRCGVEDFPCAHEHGRVRLIRLAIASTGQLELRHVVPQGADRARIAQHVVERQRLFVARERPRRVSVFEIEVAETAEDRRFSLPVAQLPPELQGMAVGIAGRIALRQVVVRGSQLEQARPTPTVRRLAHD